MIATLFARAIVKLSPIICTDPTTGQQTTADNPLSGIPFISGWGVPDGCVNDPNSTLAGQAVNGLLGPDAWSKAVTNTITTANTWWLSTPTPVVADSDTHVITGAAATLQTNLMWLTMLVMVTVMAIKGAQIAWAGARGGEPLEELVRGVFDWFIAAGIFAGLVGVGLTIADAAAAGLMTAATNGTDFGKNMTAFLADPGLLAGLGIIGGIAWMIVALFFTGLQVLFMAGRDGTLVVIVGVYLLSASTASLKQGRVAHRRLTAWVIGLVLYKLAAACVYAGGFMLIGTPTSSTNAGWSIATGISLEVVAILTLFALVKMAMPAIPDEVTGRGYTSAVTSGAFLATR